MSDLEVYRANKYDEVKLKKIKLNSTTNIIQWFMSKKKL